MLRTGLVPLFVLSSSLAAADNTPVVHGVTATPLTGRQALAGGAKPIRLTFDAAPPASVPFFLELPTSDSGATAVLQVWPLAEQQNTECDASPPESARQSYRLGMGTVKENDVWYLRATVPALQVRQKFCFAVTITFTLSAADMTDIAADAGRKILGGLLRGGSCAPGPDVMGAALGAALDGAGLHLDSTNLAGVRATGEFSAKGRDKCLAFLDARNRHQSVRGQLPNFVAALDRAADTSKLRPLPGLPAPRIMVQNSATDLLAIAKEGTAPNVLSAAEAQVRSRTADQNYSDGDREKLGRWADAVKGLKEAVALDAADPLRKAKIATALADIASLAKQPLSTAEILADPAAGRYTSSSLLIGTNAGAKLPASAVLDDLDVLARLRPAGAGAIATWKVAFSKIAQAQGALGQAKQDEQTLAALADTTAQALGAVLADVFSADGVRTALVISAPPIKLTNIAGNGTTPAAANYASVDAGAFLGFPSGGSTTETWLVPYLGLNLYSTPVDRTIELSQLTGGRCTRLRQRLSATIGMTLSQPSIVGRTITAPLAGHYPIVALGFRLTNFTRVTAGAALYKIADANPASAGQALAAAPFFGFALDIDVIHLLTQAKL